MIRSIDDDERIRDALTHDYALALREYMNGVGEDALARAYELGRTAVANGIGVVELTLLHQSVAAHVVPAPTLDEQERSAQFLAESLSPFELTHRGFRETNERLEQLNQELRGKNQQLEQATRELTQANQATRAANRELEAFSHTVAHDLRSPLNAIIGFAELLAEDEHSPQRLAFLSEITQAGQRMNRLIGALLEFARNARVELCKAPVDLSALANRVVARLRIQGQYARARVTVAPDLHACADPALLEILLTNLLSNALKYSAKVEAPRIEVGSLSESAGVATFYVRDNGAGFDMAHAGKLFGVFQRLHPVEAFEGNGVGLATVQRIIRRHGGDVWAEGVVDQGATFYFTLAAPRG